MDNVNMDNVNSYLKNHVVRNIGDYLVLHAQMVCADGFTMSVQASETHYCTPRRSLAYPYSEFEVGFPSTPEEALMPYDASNGSEDAVVFANVPLEVIQTIIAKHGGIRE